MRTPIQYTAFIAALWFAGVGGCAPLLDAKMDARFAAFSKSIEQKIAIQGEGNKTSVNDPTIMWGVIGLCGFVVLITGAAVGMNALYHRRRLHIYDKRGSMS